MERLINSGRSFIEKLKKELHESLLKMDLLNVKEIQKRMKDLIDVDNSMAKQEDLK